MTSPPPRVKTMIPPWAASLLAATLWAVLSACATDDPTPRFGLARDSAGIEIVDNGEPNSPTLARYELGERPRVVIGLDDTTPGHMLNQVVGAFRLNGGGLVVGDRGSREIRFFTEDGRHLLSVGGQGEGPGEFRLLVALDRMPGDTVVASAWPVGLRTWWDATGEHIDDTESGRWGLGLVGGRTLPDGTLLVDVYDGASYGNSIELWAAQGEDGSTFRTEGLLLRVSREGQPTDTIAPIVGDEWFKIGEVRTSGFANHVRPYTYETHLAFNDRQIVLGESHLSEVRVYGYDGTLERIVRWEHERLPVTAGDRRRFRQEVLRNLTNPTRRPAFERWLSEVTYPETKPVFRDLATDRAGRLWVQGWTADEEVDRWLIFERSGTLVGTVVARSDLRVLDAAEDYVLVLVTDDLGVETVQLFELLES